MGKTTLLKMITGEVRPDNGQVIRGDTVQFGHYTQSDLEYEPGQRVIEIVKEVADVVRLGTGQTVMVSKFLETFLFPPEKQYDFVEKLSGGEKRRLQLLLMLMKEPNFLILDEPTNDLDISSLNVLEEFLSNFPGCLMIVSHDRYFLDQLVDHLFVFEGEGKIRDFPGNYSDYRVWLEEQEATERQESNGKSSNKNEVAKEEAAVATESKVETTNRKLSFKERREMEQLEAELPKLENRKAALIQKLDGGGSHEELTTWAVEIEQLTDALSEKEMRWLELSEIA